MSSSIIIIGGGIMGLLCARELSQHFDHVTLIEQNAALGSEASGAGSGIGLPLYPWRYADAVSALVERGQQYYSSFVEELVAETGMPIEQKALGLLILEAEEHLQAITWAERFHCPIEVLSQAKAKNIAPQVQNVGHDCLWLPNILRIPNNQLLAALTASLKKRQNIRILTSCQVNGFVQENERVTGVNTSQGFFAADQLVLAAGAWTGDLLTHLGWQMPIFPVRGQVLLWQLSKSLLSCMVLAEERYLVPRPDNYLLVGSTVECVGFDKTTTQAAHDELYEKAVALLPALAQEKIVKQWAGLRPGSLQGIPFIGKLPGIENVWVNAGHYRNGLIMAPAANELLTDLLLARKPKVAAHPYQWVLTRKE